MRYAPPPILLPASIALLGACVGLAVALAPQAAPPAQAVAYSPDLPAGSRCTVPIDMLRPTQFAVGYWEVDRRAENIAQKTPKKLAKYLQEHVGRIVIGPGGVPYLIDGHHLALALRKAKVAHTLEVRVVANWRHLTPEQFWEKMQQNNWVYLYDENGDGPLDVEKLPRRLTDLRDDPYRALAWAVRDQGGYRKTDMPFAEFHWANFFRSRIKIGKQSGDFQRAIQEGLRLARTPAASHLPGYLGSGSGDQTRPADDSGAADLHRYCPWPLREKVAEEFIEDWRFCTANGCRIAGCHFGTWHQYATQLMPDTCHHKFCL